MVATRAPRLQSYFIHFFSEMVKFSLDEKADLPIVYYSIVVEQSSLMVSQSLPHIVSAIQSKPQLDG